jgi:hypothetical protein
MRELSSAFSLDLNLGPLILPSRPSRAFRAALLCCLLIATAGCLDASGQQVRVTFPPSSPDPLAHLVAGHPRLIANAAQFNALVNSNDPMKIEVEQRIIATANSMLNVPLVTYSIDGPEGNLLNASRAAFQDIVLAAMAYRLTHEVAFADRARAELLNVSAFPDWNPVHFLDTGEMAMGVALGYDWIYDALSPQDRTTIQQALITKALAFVPQIYGPKATNPSQLSWQYQWVLGEYNWNQVCNGGMLAAALAVADVQPTLARQVVQGVRAYLPIALQGYAPDGAWFEGPVYMSYATGYTILSLSILQSALGTDFGLSTVEPALADAAVFHMQMQNASELLFNYGDAHAEDDINYGAHPAFGWLVTKFGSAAAAEALRANLVKEFARFAPNQETDQYFAFNALWLPPDPGSVSPPALDAHFRGGADVAVFHSSSTDPNAIFLGFKAGTNGLNHSHLDLGSFIFDSDGQRWSIQLGPDNYGLPYYNTITPGSPRWTYFRDNDCSKSTIVPAHLGQSVAAIAPIYSFKSTPAEASAVADLTSAYPGAAKKILRGAFLLNRTSAFVQDDISDLEPNTPLRWQMLTMASIAIAPGGHTATLTLKKKTLQVEILSPANATFSIASAAPPTAAETPNPGYSVLVATVPAAPKAGDVRVAVLLTPIGPNWPTNPAVPQLEALPLPPQ